MWTIIFFTSWQCSSFVMGNDDWLSHLSDESQLKMWKNAPLSHQKVRVFFVISLVQLLMIGQVWIFCMALPQMARKELVLLRNLGFSDLHSTSFNPRTILFKWSSAMKAPENLQKWCPLTSSLKKWILLIFGLHWTSDETAVAIWATKVNWNAEGRPPKSLKDETLILYYVQLLMIWPSNLSDESWSKCRKNEMCFS